MTVDYKKEFEDFCSTEKNLVNLILSRVPRFKDQVALKHKPEESWISYTWQEFGDTIESAARALIDHGISKGDMVGIFAHNRAEWSIADAAVLAVRAVDVPVYGTNSAEEAEYIINDAGIKLIFVGDQEQYDKVAEVFKKCRTLEKIIAFDRRIDFSLSESEYFDDFLEKGRQSKSDPELKSRIESIDIEDLVTLIYTSGTTGNPKGTMLSHRNFFAMIYSTNVYFPNVKPGHVSMALLPMSHVFERAWTYGVFTNGKENHYCRDPKELLDFYAEVRPHFGCTVPRIWEKIYGTIYDRLETASPAKQKLFHWAVDTAKKVYFKKEDKAFVSPLLSLKHFIAKVLVLKKVQQIVGGRNISFNCGGAALSAEINDFFNAVGIRIGQGYGLTEFFVICVSNYPLAKSGTCGPIVPNVEVKIADDGEILVKGPHAMMGYYNNPEATKQAFDEEGWFITGDIGEVDSDGFLKLTDRKKDLIITAGGKNISPQQIELLVGEEIYIENVAIVGDGRKFISALIVPSFEMLKEMCAKQNIAFESPEQVIKEPEVIEFYRQKIEERTASLGQVEKIKKFTLLPKEFSQEEGEITPTMKVRRRVVSTKYAEEIEGMYTE